MQRDIFFMIAEIYELLLRVQNMEQEVHMQHEEFFALHDVMWERAQHLELVTGQTMPNYGSQYGINKKSTVLCSDISANNGGQPVAASANRLSAATLVRADSQQRTSIDPLNFISLESSGGISLTGENPGEFEFIMDCAINCSFDGSHVSTSVSIDEGLNQTPTNGNEGTGLSSQTPASSTNGYNAKSAEAAKDDYVMTSGGATPLPSDEGTSSMVLDGEYDLRHQEEDPKATSFSFRGYLAKPGLAYDIIALGRQMLGRICAHEFIPA